MRQDVTTGGNSQKPQKDHPWQRHRFVAREGFLEPPLGLAMVRTAAVNGVEQEVEVDEYHALSATLQLSRRFLVLERSGQAKGFVDIDGGCGLPQVESWAAVRLGPPGRSWVDPASQYPVQELLERDAATVRLIAQAFQQALVDVDSRSHV